MSVRNLIAFLSAWAIHSQYDDPKPPTRADGDRFADAADALRRLERLEAKEKG